MTTVQAEKIARRKLSLLQLAQELGNVSRACKIVGYSRQQFYEIRRNFQMYGAEGLIDRLPGAKSPHPNRVSTLIQVFWKHIPGLWRPEREYHRSCISVRARLGDGSPSGCGAGALRRIVGVSCRTAARSPTQGASLMDRGSSIGVALLTVSAFLLGTAVRSADADAAPASPSREVSDSHITLQHVTLTVSDLQASLRFYKGVLGLEEIDAPFLPEELAFLALGDGLELHVSEVPGVEIAPMASNHFAVTVADFDAFLTRLRSEGVTYYAEDGEFTVQARGDGVRQTYFSDPDGYWIEVNDFPGEGAR